MLLRAIVQHKTGLAHFGIQLSLHLPASNMQMFLLKSGFVMKSLESFNCATFCFIVLFLIFLYETNFSWRSNSENRRSWKAFRCAEQNRLGVHLLQQIREHCKCFFHNQVLFVPLACFMLGCSVPSLVCFPRSVCLRWDRELDRIWAFYFCSSKTIFATIALSTQEELTSS